jgi:hypothetical protein
MSTMKTRNPEAYLKYQEDRFIFFQIFIGQPKQRQS